MTRIHVLEDRVANQIAAGEVIERPAAVVKELVENALDAGATRVEVEFSHGGRSLMRVEDNGGGMSAADAQLALQRHATSKIQEADDLNRLATFGFRGEALPSIASVSRFLLQTREAGSESGTEIFVNGGKYVHVRECGRPVGTRIEVTQLFNSVPARRKFLKSDTTEAAHIIHNVRLYALAFPHVSFTLIEDGRLVFKSPRCFTLAERIAGIFGKQIAEGLVPLEVAEQGMRLSGLIGPPGQGRATRHEMVTFINQRPVDSRTLNYALIESYHESLPKGRYPTAFVFFDIPPPEVDVNVHPAKREVRFRNEPVVRSFVIRSVLARVRELLRGQSPEFTVVHPRLPEEAPASAPGEGRGPTLSEAGALRPAFGFEPGPSVVRPAASSNADQPPRSAPAFPVLDGERGDAVTTGTASNAAGPRGWRFLSVIHREYALFETPSGLGILDRRAAEERVLFERVQAQAAASQVHSQRLLLPVPLELDSISSALLLEACPFLNAHGFEISEFGRHFFRVEAVPEWMQAGAAETFVRDLVALLREGRLHVRDLHAAREELARFASDRAVRLADAPGEADIQALLKQLFSCRMPLISPAGRPTFSELGQGELGRRFGR